MGIADAATPHQRRANYAHLLCPPNVRANIVDTRRSRSARQLSLNQAGSTGAFDMVRIASVPTDDRHRH